MSHHATCVCHSDAGIACRKLISPNATTQLDLQFSELAAVTAYIIQRRSTTSCLHLFVWSRSLSCMLVQPGVRLRMSLTKLYENHIRFLGKILHCYPSLIEPCGFGSLAARSYAGQLCPWLYLV